MDIPTRLPALFLSHGSPMLATEDSPAGRFLDGLGAQLPWPKAVVVASAHFMTDRPMLGGSPQPHTVHDFGGFPEPLYQIQYPAPGSPELAEDIAARLADAGLPAKVRPDHGLDHGVWVPLRRMYPDADMPVVPLSVMPHGTAAQHYAIGQALAPLRDEGVLVIGSGGFVHNLGDLDWQHKEAPLAPWAREFGDWMHEAAGADHQHAFVAQRRQRPADSVMLRRGAMRAHRQRHDRDVGVGYMRRNGTQTPWSRPWFGRACCRPASARRCGDSSARSGAPGAG